MELRTYLQIIWRRIWIIVLIVGVVTLYSAYQYYATHKPIGQFKTYRSSVTLRIGLQATSHSTDQNYADYVNTNETLADELATGPIINSSEFGTQLSQQIQKDLPAIKLRYGDAPDLGDWQHGSTVAAALSATRSHGLVTINVNWNTEAGAWAITRAVGEVSVAHISTYLDYEVRGNVSATNPANLSHPLAAAKIVSESAQPSATLGTQSSITTPLVLIIAALIVGIALAFLVEYLDDRVRTPEEMIELLELPIYGKIPRVPASTHKQAAN